jgi:predicted RNA-binding Zn-ribbon protein involved in translation (DUF1610 family)
MKKDKTKILKCKCCKQETTKQNSLQKYCPSCGRYIRDLKLRLYSNKHEMKLMRTKLYGTPKKGSERMRYKNVKKR